MALLEHICKENSKIFGMENILTWPDISSGQSVLGASGGQRYLLGSIMTGGSIYTFSIYTFFWVGGWRFNGG